MGFARSRFSLKFSIVLKTPYKTLSLSLVRKMKTQTREFGEKLKKPGPNSSLAVNFGLPHTLYLVPSIGPVPFGPCISRAQMGWAEMVWAQLGWAESGVYRFF